MDKLRVRPHNQDIKIGAEKISQALLDIEGGDSIASVARALGLPYQRVYRWTFIYRRFKRKDLEQAFTVPSST